MIPSAQIVEERYGHRLALFSPCRRYRYELWDRPVRDSGYCMWLMLNPSTADAFKNDPTVERCRRFSMAWGHENYAVANLFAWRATDPRDMKAKADPVGPENDARILAMAQGADRIVCAWGAHGTFLHRARAVRRLLRDFPLQALALTRAGEPGHPLYLRGDLEPFALSGPRAVGGRA